MLENLKVQKCIVAISGGLEEKKKRMQNYLSQTTRHTLHVEAIKLKRQ